VRCGLGPFVIERRCEAIKHHDDGARTEGWWWWAHPKTVRPTGQNSLSQVLVPGTSTCIEFRIEGEVREKNV
jgi:hypothetical protein